MKLLERDRLISLLVKNARGPNTQSFQKSSN